MAWYVFKWPFVGDTETDGNTSIFFQMSEFDRICLEIDQYLQHSSWIERDTLDIGLFAGILKEKL
jgi:hypothetical protein